MKNSIDLFDDMMQEAEDIKQRKQMGEQLLKDIPDLYDKLKLRDATYSDGVIHVEPVIVDDSPDAEGMDPDLFDDMMQKYDDTMPEPVIVDESPDAEGMDPELFNDLLNGIQEIADIESGKIDASDYDIMEIQPNNVTSSLQDELLARMNSSNTHEYRTPDEVKAWLDDDKQW